jgi:hypothetical protein
MPPTMRWLVALVVWAASVVGAVALSNVVSTSAKSQQAAASFDAGEVTAADSNSLFHSKNFGKLLGIVRGHVGAGATFDSVVIYPGYVSMTQVKGTQEADLYVAANGRFDTTDTGSHIGSDPLFTLIHVRADVPARIAQRIDALAHTPLSQLHYMVYESDPVTHRARWLVYTVAGNPITYFETSGPHGRLFKLGSSGLEPVRG